VALAEWVAVAARRERLTVVALGGGCLLNRLLAMQLTALLRARGLTVLIAAQAPPNDGGISLGQAWVAQRRLIDGAPAVASSPNSAGTANGCGTARPPLRQ
jgi:hydrogenase maturation protein HypF